MSSIIREVELKDKELLTELMYAYIVGFYGKPRPDVAKIHRLISNLHHEQGGIQFVVETEGQLIGFATLYFAWSTMRADPITIMNDLFLLAPFRGTAVEEALFRHCQNYTKEHGYAYMSWITGRDNVRAQAFFDQMGATRTDWVNYSIR
ncbi:GCN5 family acetyltransferase [Paenibacillus pectinilyticus]|uniref:GCN5 family acetyltransferase n=1 Tax=Paenibacillus pectinilyticus TaxID=512399 RepID=A0A1C0ZTK0_9BACL|nr:GNAT family N-acetyltransferase [Paenibacillus pectinilyticus]OCT11391.1 GCN5 family acetyltransferase [Paenibacillus pectinilyticus]